jgi:hypothetical protein
VSPICQSDCTSATTSGFELDSLLDLKWREFIPSSTAAVSQLNVSFTKSGRELESRAHTWQYTTSIRAVDTTGLNRVLDVVQSSNLPHLATYLRCGRTFKSVRCSTDGSWVCFYFSTQADLTDLQDAAKIKFGVSPTGQHVPRVYQRADLCVVKQVPKLWKNLLEYIVDEDDSAIYDLTGTEKMTNMLRVNHMFRGFAFDQFSKKKLHAKLFCVQVS